MQQSEQRKLEDLALVVLGFLYGFYIAILAILIGGLFRAGFDVPSSYIGFIDITIQEIIKTPRSARTIARIIYRILNRMR